MAKLLNGERIAAVVAMFGDDWQPPGERSSTRFADAIGAAVVHGLLERREVALPGQRRTHYEYRKAPYAS